MHVPQTKKRENEKFSCFGGAGGVECLALKERQNFGWGRVGKLGEFGAGEVRLITYWFSCIYII